MDLIVNNLKFIDLFAGVGGFHAAFHQFADCVMACEWDKNARITYLANWEKSLEKNNATFFSDITKIDYSLIPDFDIMCAGFPCQPFSIAGEKLGFSHATQGTLFFNLLQIAKIKKPKVLFLENVKNLVTHDKGQTFKTIISSLEELGYFVHYKVLNSLTHANIPQNRERIFIVAFLNKSHFDNFIFPQSVPLTLTISNILEKKKVRNDFYQTNRESKAVNEMLVHIKKKNTIYQYRRFYLRENKNNICPTLTANMGTGGHNVPLILDNFGVRKLTPRECFNFQGFPENFILPSSLANSHLYKQAGNSITVPLVHRIAQQIILALSH